MKLFLGAILTLLPFFLTMNSSAADSSQGESDPIAIEKIADKLREQNAVECIELYRDCLSQLQEMNAPGSESLRVLKKLAEALKQNRESSLECSCAMVRLFHVHNLQDIAWLKDFLQIAGVPPLWLLKQQGENYWIRLRNEIADVPAITDNDHKLKADCFRSLTSTNDGDAELFWLAALELQKRKSNPQPEEANLLRSIVFAFVLAPDQPKPEVLASGILRLATIAEKQMFDETLSSASTMVDIERNSSVAKAVEVESALLNRAKLLGISSAHWGAIAQHLGALYCLQHQYADAERCIVEVIGEPIKLNQNNTEIHQQQTDRNLLRLCLSFCYLEENRLEDALAELEKTTDQLSTGGAADIGMIEPIANSLKAMVEAKQLKFNEALQSAIAASLEFAAQPCLNLRDSEAGRLNPSFCAILPDELANLRLKASLLQRRKPSQAAKIKELRSLTMRISQLQRAKEAATHDVHPNQNLDYMDAGGSADAKLCDSLINSKLQEVVLANSSPAEKIESLTKLASKALELCRFESALKVLQAASNLSHSNSETLALKVYTETMLGDSAAVKRDFEQLMPLSGTPEEIGYKLAAQGRLETSNNRFQEAVHLLKAAVDNFPTDTDHQVIEKYLANRQATMMHNGIVFDLVCAYYENGQISAAQDVLTAMMRSETQGPRTNTNADTSLLALIFCASGHMRLAQTTMEDVLDNLSANCGTATLENALATFHAGMLAEKQNNEIRAKRYFNQASRLLDTLKLSHSPLAQRIRSHQNGDRTPMRVGLF